METIETDEQFEKHFPRDRAPLQIAYDAQFNMWFLHDGVNPDNSVGPFESFTDAVTYLETKGH